MMAIGLVLLMFAVFMINRVKVGTLKETIVILMSVVGVAFIVASLLTWLWRVMP